MRNEQFWNEHIEVYNYIRDNYQSFRDIDLVTGISERFKIEIASENIRYLRRREGWKKRVSTTAESVEKFEKVVFVGDFHIPFHDVKLVKLFMQFLHYFKPDKLFLMGDLLDCYSLSKYLKTPKRIATLQDELDIAEGLINQIYRVVKDIVFFEGNHEERIRTHLKAKPQLFGLRCLEISELLDLKSKGIKSYPYMHCPVKYHGLQIHHGTYISIHSGWTAKKHYTEFGGCGIIGHCHRGGSYLKRDMQGVFGWWENMCMSIVSMEYRNFFNWIQGWSVAYFTKKDLFHLEQVPVIKHKFLFQGKLFSAK